MRVQAGEVVGVPKRESRGGPIDVLFDGNTMATRVHRTYIEPVT